MRHARPKSRNFAKKFSQKTEKRFPARVVKLRIPENLKKKENLKISKLKKNENFLKISKLKKKRKFPENLKI